MGKIGLTKSIKIYIAIVEKTVKCTKIYIQLKEKSHKSSPMHGDINNFIYFKVIEETTYN